MGPPPCRAPGRGCARRRGWRVGPCGRWRRRHRRGCSPLGRTHRASSGGACWGRGQPPALPAPSPADHVGRCPWGEGSGWTQREGLTGWQGTIRVRGVCLLPDSGGSGRSRRGCRPRSTVGGTWAHGGRWSAGTIWVGRAPERVDCPSLIRPRTGGGVPLGAAGK